MRKSSRYGTSNGTNKNNSAVNFSIPGTEKYRNCQGSMIAIRELDHPQGIEGKAGTPMRLNGALPVLRNPLHQVIAHFRFWGSVYCSRSQLEVFPALNRIADGPIDVAVPSGTGKYDLTTECCNLA